MRDKRKDVEKLMVDLAHLSGLAYDVIGEDVDWFVDDMESITGSGRTDASSLDEGPEAKKAAQKETLKGELETLAKRLGGVVEFVDDGKLDQASVSLEKILIDGQRILEKLPKAKASKPASKATQKPKQQQQPSPESGGEPKGPGAPSPDERKELGGQTAREAGESVYVDGYLITEGDRRDPFGFGVGLVDQVRGLLGMKDKHKG